MAEDGHREHRLAQARAHVKAARRLIRVAISIAAAVQHHPSRAFLLDRLLPLLDQMNVRVVADPGGRIADPWRSHRACLEAMPAGADGILVIQDDALPVHSFIQKANEAITARPDRIVCLFAPGFRPIVGPMLQAQQRGDNYVRLPYLAFVPVVCIWYPAAVVVSLLAWADRRRCIGADDGIVARFVREKRLEVLLTVPCLVDHDEQVASVRGGVRGGPHRRAALL